LTTRKEQKILNNQSMSSNFESDQISIMPYSGYSIQFVTTSSAIGTFRILTSNDEEGVSSANSTWDELEGAEYSAPNASSFTVCIDRAYYGKIKLQYTASSGSGNVTAKFVGKD
jgi:hypothetical protein